MIVDVAHAPVGGLVAENVAAFVEGLVGGAPEDAAGVGVAGALVVVEEAVVAVEGGAVVVPVPGHGERIGDPGAEVGVFEGHRPSLTRNGRGATGDVGDGAGKMPTLPIGRRRSWERRGR